ncbi:MAG TPA: sugar ABC transporter permease [Lachnospiraceae bacterium]|nr:sugar ABC transporter permease [Lachnospiraceae bacterium]
MKAKSKIKKSKGDMIFDVINTCIMILMVIMTLYPFYYVVIASVSDNTRLQAYKGILMLPQGFNLGAYKLAFEHPLILSGYKNILIVLAIYLPLSILMTVLCANFMAAKKVMFKKPLVLFMMFTMYFSGGLIPTFLNIRELGMYNSLSALIIPGCLSLYNAFIVRTAIEGIPDSLYESAYMDGASELQILFKITLPLIKPTLAVILLYYGVGKWNEWFSAAIYIKDNAKLPIQNILRSILIENSEILNAKEYGDTVANSFTETIKYAAIVISTVPILCIYPMVQKHFTKGVMIGAVKG